MPDIWGYLLVKYDLRSVLDVGCGYGHALEWFQKNGCCVVTGVDGDPDAIKNCKIADIKEHDYTKGLAPVGTPYDLGWSAEFLEHVEEKYIPNFMPTFRLCRYVCVTHGEPGQYGHHHVNCQDSSYWIKKFTDYGLEYDPIETQTLRRTDRWRAGWGRRSLLWFRRIK